MHTTHTHLHAVAIAILAVDNTLILGHPSISKRNGLL